MTRISLIAAAIAASFVLAACGGGYDADSTDSGSGYGSASTTTGGSSAY